MNYENIYAEWVANGSKLDPNGSVFHEIKMYYIWRTLQRTGYRSFVESGTCYGAAVQAMLPYVDEVYTIEAFQPCYDHCAKLFEGDDRVNLYLGDSGQILPQILDDVDLSVFWLDAHYSGDGTALLDKETPIVAELEAIAATGKPHALIIDDARGFGVWNDYPTIEWMRGHCLSLFPDHDFYLEGDELFVTP